MPLEKARGRHARIHPEDTLRVAECDELIADPVIGHVVKGLDPRLIPDNLEDGQVGSGCRSMRRTGRTGKTPGTVAISSGSSPFTQCAAVR